MANTFKCVTKAGVTSLTVAVTWDVCMFDNINPKTTVVTVEAAV